MLWDRLQEGGGSQECVIGGGRGLSDFDERVCARRDMVVAVEGGGGRGGAEEQDAHGKYAGG